LIPESVISETDIENNKANAAFSIEAKEEDNDNSLLRWPHWSL